MVDGCFTTFNADLPTADQLHDDRSIKFNADLLPGGPLHELRNLVDAHDDLELCYRGNNRRSESNGEKIIIYYNSHVMFDVMKQENNYVLTLSFNHARYEENWQDVLNDLHDNYRFKKSTNISRLECCFEGHEKIKWDELYKMLEPIYNRFFKLSSEYVTDYIETFQSGCGVEKKKRNYLEKIRQQQIFSANANCNNGYFFYDLEFQPPHEDKDAADNDGNKNKPDMLAIKYVNGSPTKLVFVEVKTRKEACTKKESGVRKHLICTAGWLKEYYENPNDKFMKARKEEVPKIIQHYADLGLRGLKQTQKFDFSDIDIEVLLIFTDEEAINWAKDNRKDIESWAGDYLDKLVIAQADESGEILPL